MTVAQQEIRNTAEILGWDCHPDDARREDTFLYGPHMVTVDYHRDGTIEHAYRYHFLKVNDVKLQETTQCKNKKVRVIGWLAGYCK